MFSHVFTVTVPILHERSQSLPPMPVAIDNGLPHVCMPLGSQPDPSGDQFLEGLLDTCAALNTGYTAIAPAEMLDLLPS